MNGLKAILVIAVVLVVCTILTGCAAPLPGFRFAPGEQQKQLAQAGAELAAVASTSGLPPGSAATRRLADAARTSAAFAGYPSEPVNIEDLVPPSVANAWTASKRKAEAMSLKSAIHAKASEVTTAAMANLLTGIEQKAQVATDGLIARVQAIVDVARMSEQIAEAVPVPGADGISPAEAARLAAINDTLKRVNAAAAAQAARRPTVAEVADKAVQTTDTVIGGIGDLLDNYGLLALIPGAAGIYYGAKKRTQARRQQSEADQARHDEMNARQRADMAHQTANAAVERAMSVLAAAQPAAGKAADAPAPAPE